MGQCGKTALIERPEFAHTLLRGAAQNNSLSIGGPSGGQFFHTALRLCTFSQTLTILRPN